MAPGIGEERIGKAARAQIADLRHDPRLERKRGAMVADFEAAMAETEHVRLMGILGLHELTHALERQEALLGVSRADENLSDDTSRTLQAAWERAETARIEIAKDHPHLNAMALMSINSALDALVEEWVPAMREIGIKMHRGELLGRVERGVPEAATSLTDDVRLALGEVVDAMIAKELPKLKRLQGSGVERYEARLRQVGLGAPDDRPIPADLDQALSELGALRDVVTHRAGRVDATALQQAPSLRYEDGEFVRIRRDEYRTYSAAVRCYAREITFRSLRSWPEMTDDDGPDLSRWRQYAMLGA